jgi:hypothetical protein
MATTNLKIDALDFDSIKQNLKTYLKSQDQFKDYDFEGSGMNVLMDILAYNTHYQSFYANMVANETFLDSALFNPSVVSIAKHLNYTPRSYRSSVAYVDVEFLNVSGSTQTSILSGTEFIPVNSRFMGTLGSQSFVFYSTSNTLVQAEGARYFARNVEIKEGFTKTITYVYNSNTNTDQKFTIPETNVDTTSLEVRVSRSITNTGGIENIWTQVNDINKLGSDSKVYFLQMNSSNQYEIYFGDGIIGEQPQEGNVITIFYRTCSGSLANGVGLNDTATSRSFRYLERAASQTTLLIGNDGKYSPSYGGSDLETVQSIKYYAPRNYQAQERAVTADDYRLILTRDYGEQAESVYVWGGEENNPPVYGKVFISVKPKNAIRLTQLQKLAIATAVLKEKNIVSIIPEVVDPDYLYLVLDVSIKYDSSKTTLTKESLEQNIKNLIYLYSLDNVGKFDRDFVESTFTTHINTNYTPPVVSSKIDLQLRKKFEPNLTVVTNYTIDFDNELFHPIEGYTPILSSTLFGYQDSTSDAEVKPNVDAFLEDDGSGKIRIYKLVTGEKVFLNRNAGTINYTTGVVTLVNFVPQYLTPESEFQITLTAIPKENDVTSRRNQILLCDFADISVTCSPQLTRTDQYYASGSAFGG